MAKVGKIVWVACVLVACGGSEPGPAATVGDGGLAPIRLRTLPSQADADRADQECAGLPSSGICVDHDLTWCENDEVYFQSCAEWGLRCEESDKGAMCAGSEREECAELGEYGACDGAVARFCVGMTLWEKDCAVEGLTCLDSPNGVDCFEPPATDPICEEIGEVGRCEDNAVTYCEDGQPITQQCGEGSSCVVGVCSSGASCCSDEQICNTVGMEGSCAGPDGNTAVNCVDGEVLQEACGEGGTRSVCQTISIGTYCVGQ